MAKIIICDEINAILEDVPQRVINKVIERTKFPVKDAFMMAEFKAGLWDGKSSFMDEDGLFFQAMIDDVSECLIDMGYDIDDIEIEDERVPFTPLDSSFSIDKHFLQDMLGFPLRDHQVKGLNKAVTHTNGLYDWATSSGKTILCGGLCKMYEHLLPSITVVPSQHLMNQTAEDYEKLGLDYYALTAKTPVKKRKEMIESHRHIIVTNKLLMNCEEIVSEKQYMILLDEGHHFGKEWAVFYRTALRNCPVRYTFSGSFPFKDKWKIEMIKNHVGGDVIDTVKAKEIIENKHAATLDIEMVTVRHDEFDQISELPMWDWTNEMSYMTGNREMLAGVAEYIKSLPVKNTLVLCHAAAGKILTEHFDGRMIVDETPVETRQEWVSEFDTKDDAMIFGSWGTIATGMSKNRIFRVILINVSKDQSAIRQSIGRGIRLDGVEDHVEVVDISCSTKFAKRHRKERVKVYDEENFPYHDSKDVIIIK